MKQYMILICLAVSMLLGLTACDREVVYVYITRWINNTSYDMKVQISSKKKTWQFDLLRGDTIQLHKYTHYLPEDCPNGQPEEPFSLDGKSVSIFDINTDQLIFQQSSPNGLLSYSTGHWSYTSEYDILYDDLVFADGMLALSWHQCPCEQGGEPIEIDNLQGVLSFDNNYSMYTIECDNKQYRFFSTEKYPKGYVIFSGIAYRSPKLDSLGYQYYLDNNNYCITELVINYQR